MDEKLLATALLVSIGCAAPPPIEPCGTIELSDTIDVSYIDRLDLLFVIDDSASMAASRAHLVTEIPRMASALATGDLNGDGVVDTTTFESLHIGVITTDLGASGGGGAASCSPSGEDALFIRGSVDLPGCPAEHASGIFDFAARTTDPYAFASEVGCAATTTSDGCGVEQPLEAALRALSPSARTSWTRDDYEPPIFADGSFGHGDGANAGFLRPDSVLSVIVLTNEDDCSVYDVDAELASVDPADPDPSCGGAGGLLPIERFVDGLLALRRQRSLLTFTVVAGVPPALTDSSYGELLADPAMQPVPDPSRPGHLLPSCTSVDGVEAAPPRRLVEVARALESRGSGTRVASICEPSFAYAIDASLERTADALRGSCLPRPLTIDDDGRSNCQLDVALAPSESGRAVTHCEDIEGAVRLEDEVGSWDGHPAVREVCRLPALSRVEAASGARGWFYDDGDPRLLDASMLPSGCDQRIDVSRVVFNGSQLRIVCRERSGDLPLCEP